MTVDSDEGYWRARDKRVALETLAISAASGQFRSLTISADPEVPDDDDPESGREFFVEIETLDHAQGWVNGLAKRKYRILLEEVE